MASSIENKTRDIESRSRNVKSGQEFEALQEAQNQLLSIQEAQRQNLSMQANNSAQYQAQNQLLAQAGEIMSMDDLNQTTQNTLSGYGLNHPRVIKETKVIKQGPYNITNINNNTTNVQGPVQGREVSIRPQQEQQGRFKAWLNNIFARQDALFQKQNSEYIKKENALTRSANKMMRVIEKLGKEVGRVMDPRRIADTQKNQLKTVLTIIGIPLLIKYLPKAFDTIGDISNTIKGAFQKITGIFKGNKDGKSFFNNISNWLYNDSEDGLLNKLSKKLRETLMNRVELANTHFNIKGLNLIKNPGNLLNWFGVIFGGEKFAMQQQRREAMKKIGEKMDDQGDVYKNFKSTTAADRNGTKLELNSSSRFGISSVSGASLDENEYRHWLRKTGKKKSDETAKEFLAEKGFIYTGESVILTKEAHDNYKCRVLNPKYDLNSFGYLGVTSLYTSLVASLEFIHEIKRGHSNHHSQQGAQHLLSTTGKAIKYTGAAVGAAAGPVGMLAGAAIGWSIEKLAANFENKRESNLEAKTDPNILIYILYLLLERSKSSSAKALVFPEFIELTCSKELQTELSRNNDLNKIRIKLIQQPMDLQDIKKYWKNQNKGLSDYYKKITYSKNEGNPLVLHERDFNNRQDSKEWEVYHLTNNGIGKIFESLSGGQREVNLKKGTQASVVSNIETNAGNNKVDVGANKDIKTKDRTVSSNFDRAFTAYENRQSQLEDIRQEKQQFGNENIDQYDNYTLKPGWGKGLTKDQYENNKREIYNYLKKKGLTDVQIAGIMGVLQAESGLNPGAINKAEVRKYGKGIAGEGICQWTNHGRKDPMLAWVKARYGSIPEDGIMGLTLNQQLEYFWKEFTGRKKAFDIITKSNDLATVVDAMVRGFENGSAKALASRDVWPNVYKHPYSTAFKPRMGYANGFLSEFSGQSFQSTLGNYVDSSVPGAVQVNLAGSESSSPDGDGFRVTKPDKTSGRKSFARNLSWLGYDAKNLTGGSSTKPLPENTKPSVIPGISVSNKWNDIRAAHEQKIEESKKKQEAEAQQADATKTTAELIAEIGKKTVDTNMVVRNIDKNLAVGVNKMPNKSSDDKKKPVKDQITKTV